jgi:aminoglycoside phosphotransferase
VSDRANKPSRLQEEARRADQALLDAILARLPELEELARVMGGEYEDRLYRFYDRSNKVYYLQDDTGRAAELFREIGREAGRGLNPWFEEIVAAGTGIEFDVRHNDEWLRHTRPIVEAFLHARYFVEMMVRYGRQLDSPPHMLPSGWAAVLTLYGLR